ncbi:Dal5 [Kluyveromyces lactis]|nr:Dal5 [Kluyveromyces lactis]
MTNTEKQTGLLNDSSDHSSVHSRDEKIQAVVSITAEEIGDRDALITTILSPDGKEVKITGDVDDAMKLALKSQNVVLTPEKDAKLLRKIDLMLFPIMCIIYSVQFMDKITTSNAAIMGLQTDLKMHGEQYSYVGSAFYFGYLGGLFILPFLMQKTKKFMKMLTSIIVIWGMVLALHAAPSVNYPSFIFLRCLLGFLESAITPAFTVITSQYWKKEEQFSRITCWFGFNGLGSIWGGAIAYGLYIHKDSYPLAAWKLVFIITGCITIFVGFIMMIHLPDSPDKAWFFSEEEKLLLVERIRENQQGFGNHHIKKYQIVEAFKDIRTWLYFLFSVSSNIPNGGITNFSSILLKEDFQFSTDKSLLVNMGSGAVELVGCPLFGMLSFWCLKRKYKVVGSRLAWAFFATAICFMGVCMLAFAKHDKSARLAGLMLFGISPVSFICVLSCISSNTLGFTKKWTVSSINLLAYASANIAGPHTFIATQAPSYTGAKISLVVNYAAAMVIIVLIYIVNARENKRRDKIEAERTHEQVVENIEFADLTDFENLKFRYAI